MDRLPVLLAQRMDVALQNETDVGVSALVILLQVIILAFSLLSIIGMWRVFAKAGEPGWACIVPIYNLVVLLRIVGKPLWWLFLFLVPCVNIVVSFVVYIDLAKSFGKDAVFGVGLMLLPVIFFPILGFDDSKYLGPVNQPY